MSIYFLSDLHLGAPYFPDSKEGERRVTAFLDHIKEDAEEIFLLGDILDYWYEYKYVVPRGFVRFFGKLAELADRGIKITWLIGNHDIWIFDYLPNELGIEVIDGSLTRELYGHKVFMSHGDGLGKLPAGFKIIRGIFRNRFCQWLFSGIHPRWTVPFAYNWSGQSRKGGENKGLPDLKLMESLTEYTKKYHEEHPEIKYFIYGHIHIFKKEEIARGCEMIILGEWIRTFSYAKMTKEGITLHKWDK